MEENKNKNKKGGAGRIPSAYTVSKGFNVRNTANSMFANKNNGQIRFRDLNNNPVSPTFTKYTKTDILDYIADPNRYEKQLRDAVIYMYNASSHFRRLIKYFVNLTDISYIMAPYMEDAESYSGDIIKDFNNASYFVEKMQLKSQLPTILTKCWREDVAYITTWINDDSVTFQILPSDYCYISTIQDNVCNVTFDFSYFRGKRIDELEFFPKEFTTKYNLYQKDSSSYRYQELDVPDSFAIKVNKDTLEYAVPPFSGVLPAYYDLSDYQALKLTKTELENYAILVMRLGVDSNGRWTMDFDKAKDFYSNLDHVLPEEVGSVLSPMDIQKISFEHTNGDDTADNISEAEKRVWTAAGVNANIFTEVTSSSAIKLSIVNDQSLTYEIMQTIADALNRLLKYNGYDKFRIIFINSSDYNRSELIDDYTKAATLGLPVVFMWAALLNMPPNNFIGMQQLEQEAFDFSNKLIPLQNSYTRTASTTTATGEGEPGRPEQDTKDEAGEATEEQGANDDKTE